MEDPRVFEAAHALLLDLVAEGTVTGIRLDHPDGLFDPALYLSQLRDAVDDRTPAGRDRVYIVVEKILAHGERLRDGWPVQGTTGYNALNAINGVFIRPDGLTELRRAYRQFTGYRARAADTIYASKRFMMRSAMASELNILTRALNRLSEGERRFRDFTLNGLRRALTEVIACFPVYRTYVTASGAGADDAAVVDAAIAEARRRNPVQEPSIFEFIRLALLPGDNGDRPDAPTHDLRVAFAQKFQQYTAPVVAKGLEDTAFYNDVLLRVRQRGRWRSSPPDTGGRGPAREQPAAPGAVAPRADGGFDPRHQVGRGRASPHQRPLRAAARLAGTREALVVDQRRGEKWPRAWRRIATTSGCSIKRSSGRGRPNRPTARRRAEPATRWSSGCSATCERR